MFFKQSRKRILLFFLLVSLTAAVGTPRLYAQAFDGDADSKYFAGYHNVGGVSGIELMYDKGLSDEISIGFRSVLVNRVHKSEYSEENDVGLDLGFFANYHLMEALKLPDNFDIIAGGGITFLTFELHAGARYNFSEVVGVYAEARRNFAGIIKETENKEPFFSNKFGFSVGLTFNF